MKHHIKLSDRDWEGWIVPLNFEDLKFITSAMTLVINARLHQPNIPLIYRDMQALITLDDWLGKMAELAKESFPEPTEEARDFAQLLIKLQQVQIKLRERMHMEMERNIKG